MDDPLVVIINFTFLFPIIRVIHSGIKSNQITRLTILYSTLKLFIQGLFLAGCVDPT